MKPVNWRKIKAEYISSTISCRALAEKHGVSSSAVMKLAAKEGWMKQREAQKSRIEELIQQKMAVASANREVERLNRIGCLADQLLDRLEAAVQQLDNYIVASKQRDKVKTYDRDAGGNRREVETIKETERREVVKGDVDRAGLKQLTAALKDLRDVGLGRLSPAEENETGIVLLAPVRGEDG